VQQAKVGLCYVTVSTLKPKQKAGATTWYTLLWYRKCKGNVYFFYICLCHYISYQHSK